MLSATVSMNSAVSVIVSSNLMESTRSLVLDFPHHSFMTLFDNSMSQPVDLFNTALGGADIKRDLAKEIYFFFKAITESCFSSSVSVISGIPVIFSTEYYHTKKMSGKQ